MNYKNPKSNKIVTSNLFVDVAHKMNTTDYLVNFSDQTESYCVGMVDMVNSTKITHQMKTLVIIDKGTQRQKPHQQLHYGQKENGILKMVNTFSYP